MSSLSWLVFEGWTAQYWNRLVAEHYTVRARVTNVMQGYLVVATLLVVMSFPTLFGLLAIRQEDQHDTKAYKVCISFLAAGCMSALCSICLLATALSAASLPETIIWSPALMGSMRNLLGTAELMFVASIVCYFAAIPCGFFIAMHGKVAFYGTLLYAGVLAALAVLFGHHQGKVHHDLDGEARGRHIVSLWHAEPWTFRGLMIFVGHAVSRANQ